MPEIFSDKSAGPLVQGELTKGVEDIVSSYEAKIENIDSFFETTHLIFSEFQEPLLDIKQEKEAIKIQLQDLLAQNEHLRKTDFSRMMQGVLSVQAEKEKEVRNLLNCFLSEQKQMIGLFRNNLAKIKEAIAKGEGVLVKESKEVMVELLTQQDKLKREVVLKLKELQKDQQEMTKMLLELLSKGRGLRIKDLKTMLKEFEAQHKERIVQRAERREEVRERKKEIHSMLVEFKKKRKDSVKSRRINSHNAIPSVRKEKEVNQNSKIFNGVNIDARKKIENKEICPKNGGI